MMDRPELATVVDVINGKGVKIKLDGPDNEPVDTYYSTCVEVKNGDRVVIKYISGDILITNKILY